MKLQRGGMDRNIEIKAKVLDHLRLQERAHDLGRSVEHLEQEDIFFHVPEGRLKLRKVNGRSELIFYRRQERAGPKLSQYTVVPVEPPAPLEALLGEALGVKAIVRKRRTLIMVGQTRVHLDEVEGLGHFMELEVVLEPGQREADGQRVARELMGALEIEDDSLIECAYVDLLERGGELEEGPR